MKGKKITYYAPCEVKFTADQMEQIVRENMETWGISRAESEACCDEDVLLAAQRLGMIELANGYITSEFVK